MTTVVSRRTAISRRELHRNADWLDPGPRIRIPFVPLVVDRADRRLHELPAPFVLECESHRAGDEPAPAARTDAPVEIAHELVGQRYV